ncbi:Vacuolar sorting protein 26 [Entamoeba marina]
MFPFEFPPLTEYESYNGNSIRLKYYLTVTVLTKSSAKPNTQVEFLVAIPKDVTEQTAISQQLGIEKIIHFDLNLTKNVYDLDDVVMGSIYIRLLRVKIGRVDVHLVRKEFSGKPQTEKNSSIINTFGIADGQLVKGDILPIRFYLKKIPLTPTFDNIADAYSVRYYLSFVFVDDEDRKYETSLEILLNRFNAPISHEKMIPPVNVIDFERLKDVKELSMGGNADDINEEELLKEIKDEENVKQNDEKQNDDAPLSFGEPITQDDPIEEQNIQNVDESSVQKDDVITSNQEEKIDNVVVGDEPKAEDFIIEEEKKDEEEEKENDKQESIEDMNDSHTPQQESVDNELNNESADVADFISDANE